MRTLQTKEDVTTLTLEELQEIGELVFWCDDLDEAVSIKDYFKRVLVSFLMKREGFSGKRPFGNSGWEYDLYLPLVEAGVVEGTLDDEGCLDEFRRPSQDVADLILIEVAANL